MATTLVASLLPLLLSLLSDFGVNVPTSIQNLINQLSPVIDGLINDIKAGGSASTETVTILQTLVPALEAVKADTSVDPKYIEMATYLQAVLTSVVEADQDAQTSVDTTKLHTETPIS